MFLAGEPLAFITGSICHRPGVFGIHSAPLLFCHCAGRVVFFFGCFKCGLGFFRRFIGCVDLRLGGVRIGRHPLGVSSRFGCVVIEGLCLGCFGFEPAVNGLKLLVPVERRAFRFHVFRCFPSPHRRRIRCIPHCGIRCRFGIKNGIRRRDFARHRFEFRGCRTARLRHPIDSLRLHLGITGKLLVDVAECLADGVAGKQPLDAIDRVC